MRGVAPVIVGIVAGGLAWIATAGLWGLAASYLSRLMGMSGGDVGAPIIGAIAGGLLLLGLMGLGRGALLTGMSQRLLAYGGIGLVVISEWFFATYLDGLKRFISPEYDRLPAPRPVQLVDDATYQWHSAIVVGLHVAVAMLTAALLFFLVVGARKRFWNPTI